MQILERLATDDSDSRGLDLRDGLLAENTGVTIRTHDLRTDPHKVTTRNLGGATGRAVAVTPQGLWHIDDTAQAAVLRDTRSLAELRRVPFEARHQGLCYDGGHLILSDGTTRLSIVDSNDMTAVGEVKVEPRVWGSARLSDLDCVQVDGRRQVWAVVDGTDWLIRIDLATGAVTATADLSAVTVAEQPTRSDSIVGGIATIAGTDGEMWLTGRHYHNRYRVRLVRK